MNVARSAPSDSRRDDEARRYQRAAEDALVQLEWCIGYLHGIGETKVTRALARNHSSIRSALMRQPEETSPFVLRAGDESTLLGSTGS